jgi:hypothetical protein
MDREDRARPRRSDLARDAAITFVAVVVAFLALDDITTDTARGFRFERLVLAGCALWFLFVAWRFWRHGQPILGVLSFGLVAIAALAQPAVGPGMVPSVRFEYLATVGGLAWFLLVAGILAGFAWYARHSHAA